MTEDQLNLKFVRDTIAAIPIEQQVRVECAADEIRNILILFGDCGLLALALVGAEETAK